MRRKLVETYIKSMMEDERERKVLEKLKKDRRFQQLLKNLQQIDDELDQHIQKIFKNDPEFKNKGADWRDVFGMRD